MTRKKLRLLFCLILFALPSIACATTDISAERAAASATRRAWAAEYQGE